MSLFKPTYQPKVYREFQAIEPSAYRQIIRFYEDHEEDIKRLDFDEFFELLIAYVGALFETGAYRKYLLMVDAAIECTIEQNVLTYQGKDLYFSLLFRKAASLYNLMEYDRSDYILRELVKMNPDEADTVRFLKKCLRKKQPGYIHQIRAGAILFFLVSALVVSLEVLFVRPFYAAQAEAVEMVRNGLFLGGLLCLLGGDLWHRWRVEREVNDFVSSVRQHKYFHRPPL